MQERRISEMARAELGDSVEIIGLPCMDRSLQMWQAGQRTKRKFCKQWPILFEGKVLEGDFLLSTYIGGELAVITTPDWQWLGLTEELEQGKELQSEHIGNSSPWAWCLNDHVGENQAPDGHHRVLPAQGQVAARSTSGQKVWVDAKQTPYGCVPVPLTADQEERLRRVHYGFRYADTRSLAEWRANFETDLNCERELGIYEKLLPIFRDECERRKLRRADMNGVYQAITAATLYETVEQALCAAPWLKSVSSLADLFERVHEAVGVVSQALFTKEEMAEINKARRQEGQAEQPEQPPERREAPDGQNRGRIMF